MNNNNLENAKALIQQGFAIIPLKKNQKHNTDKNILERDYTLEDILNPIDNAWDSDGNLGINLKKSNLIDIDLENLSMNNEQIKNAITKKTVAVFMTHAQGFNGISDGLLKLLKQKKIALIEDVCESHGAKFGNKKLGTFGLISNFSFYYAHHLSTIEGGMVCTNNKDIYDFCVRFRGHGMLRESKFKNRIVSEKKKFKDLNENFIFLNPGFNFRSNEINATIGINQLKRLMIYLY